MKIRPKEILAMAKEAEKNGDAMVAATGFLRLGQYLFQKGDTEAASRYVRHALKLHPSSVRGNYLSALADAVLGNELKAITAASRFAKEAGRKKRVTDYASRIERDFAKFPAVRRSIYETLLSLDRTDAQLFLNAAQCAMQAGDALGARATTLGLLKAGLADDLALSLLKDVLKALKNDAGIDFVESFEKGRMLKGDLVRLLETPGSGSSVSSSFESGEEERPLAELITDLEAELGVDDGLDKVEPLLAEFQIASQPILAGDSKARIDMAMAYFGMGLYDAADAELKHVGLEDARFLEAHCLKGEVRMARGQLLEALEIYQECRRDERASLPVKEEAEYRMIQIHVRLGDKAGAISHLRNLEQMNPDYRDLRALRDSVFAVSEAAPLRAAKSRG